MSSTPEIVVCRDAGELAAKAVERILATAAEAVREREMFTIALAGGSTPEKAYTRLAGATSDWHLWHVFMGDERIVPPDDPRSNHGMARRTFLDRVPIPAAQGHPVPTSLPTPPECAAAYAHELAIDFGLPPEGPPPRFDLILLGLGDDGHTASLFPAAEALGETGWVTWSPPGTLPPPVDRVTFTFPTINAARHVLFLVAGDAKAAALRDVLEGDYLPAARPAVGVRPIAGSLTWMVDEAAARLLKPSAQTRA
jgi:6-phosphogluconolactonase